MQMSRDDGAQSNIDFLFGLAVFLMAFLYVFTFIPGLFVPYQASAVDLSSVAYKTGAVLVEDPGWYIITTPYGEMGSQAWETQDLSRLARIGLAVGKQSPNVLSIDKIHALGNISSRAIIPELGGNASYAVIREKIGLNGTLTYNYTLKLEINNTRSGNPAEVLLNITSWPKGDNVEYMERNVLVDVGRQLFADARAVPDHSAAMRVNLSDRPASDYENVTVLVYNVTGAGTIEDLRWQSNQSDPLVPLGYRTQFLVRKNGLDVPTLPVSYGPADKVEVIVYNSEIRRFHINYLWIHSATNVLPDGLFNYYNDPVFHLRSVCYPGVLKVEVWANEGI